jgi:PAS domain S-box-containing protein
VTPIHLLDCDSFTSSALPQYLSEQGYPTRHYRDRAELLAAQPKEGCILFDLRCASPSAANVQQDLAAAGIHLPLILIGTDEDIGQGIEALKNGACDFLFRPLHWPSLVSAIESAVDRRQTERRRGLAREAAVARLKHLPQREIQILRGLMGGMSNKQMAWHFGISPRTVEMHRANLMEDLGLPSLSHAIRLATDAELTPIEGPTQDLPSADALVSDRGRRPARPAPPPIAVEFEMPPVIDVLEGTTDAVMILDREDRIRFLNRNAVKTISGGRELVGMNVWDAFPLARSTRAYAQLRESAEQRRVARFDVFEPDLERWFDVSARPIPQGLLVCFHDLTPNRAAQAALKMSEERILLALDASGDGAWDFDIQNERVHLSARYMKKLGYEEGEIEGTLAAVRRLVHPDDLARMDKALGDHLAGTTDMYRCEYRFRRKSGEWAWNLDRGRIVARDSRTGAPLRMVGTATEIGWLRDLQAEAAKARVDS